MKILVPTDFSENANHAVEYAAILANANRAKLTLLHIVTLSVMSPGLRGVVDDENVANMNNAIEQLRKMVERLGASYGSGKFNYIIQEGETPEAIIRKGVTEKPDIIVMGTLGATGVKKFLFGSNTVAVMQHSTIPILAIPGKSQIKVPAKIVFATNYLSGDIAVISKLVNLFSNINVEINIVHIINESEIELDEKVTLESFQKMVASATNYDKFSFNIFRDDDTISGIKKYSSSIGADIVAVATRNRTGIDKWLNKSVSEALVYNPELPFLVFHDYENNFETEF